MLKRALAVAGIVCGALAVSGGTAAANEYPTDIVADYVIGCMVSNGETQDMLRRCSCSIDTVASILPYDKYEKAETVLMMQQVSRRSGLHIQADADAEEDGGRTAPGADRGRFSMLLRPGSAARSRLHRPDTRSQKRKAHDKSLPPPSCGRAWRRSPAAPGRHGAGARATRPRACRSSRNARSAIPSRRG